MKLDPKKLRNVTAHLNSPWAGRFVIRFALDGVAGRFHIWADTVTREMDGPIYLNPPLDCAYGEPGHFPTREFSLTAAKNQPLVEELKRQLADGSIYAAAEAEAAKEKERLRLEWRLAALQKKHLFESLRDIVSQLRDGRHPVTEAQLLKAEAALRSAQEGETA